MSDLDEFIGALILRVARDTITAHLEGGREHAADESLRGLPHNGVFVTLRKTGDLRGCIGTFDGRGELVDVVRKMARASLGDPRFVDMPLSAGELKDIRIEVSVLSPLERIEDPTDFEYGRHGIYLKCGHSTGCFLPDVGVELGWDKETFLRQLCAHKMGLRPDAWRSGDMEAWRFSVSKFVES